MEKAKNIFRRIMAGLSVLIFLFGLFVFVSVLNASAGKVPSVLGFSFMQVQTGSMEPTYPVGSIVITKKIDAEDIQKDDVISFYSTSADIAGLAVTHRVVEIQETMGGAPLFVTKGDANNSVDEQKVSAVSVIGKVVYNIGTVGGSVLSVISNPKVIFFFIVLPLIFITFGEAVNLVTMFVNSKEEEENDEQSEERKD